MRVKINCLNRYAIYADGKVEAIEELTLTPAVNMSQFYYKAYKIDHIVIINCYFACDGIQGSNTIATCSYHPQSRIFGGGSFFITDASYKGQPLSVVFNSDGTIVQVTTSGIISRGSFSLVFKE